MFRRAWYGVAFRLLSDRLFVSDTSFFTLKLPKQVLLKSILHAFSLLFFNSLPKARWPARPNYTGVSVGNGDDSDSSICRERSNHEAPDASSLQNERDFDNNTNLFPRHRQNSQKSHIPDDNGAPARRYIAANLRTSYSLTLQKSALTISSQIWPCSILQSTTNNRL